MSSSEIPLKPRRKKVDVPVHRNKNDNDATLKTYSANFNAKKERKFVNFPVEVHENDLVANDAPVPKTSKKLLRKEIARLNSENQELTEKLNQSENSFLRKAGKMKEKLLILHNYNSQLVNDNETMKLQYQELFVTAEELRTQLELKRNCQSCEELKSNLEKTSSEYKLLRKTNKELLEDINMLKNVVYRLNLQMERYQEKLRKNNLMSPPPISENASKLDVICTDQVLSETHHSDHPHTPISWGKVNAHTLGPLLDSYQETIAEKEGIIQTYETEFANFTGRIKEVLSENEILHQKLTEDDECSVKLRRELEGVREELRSTREQNDLLIKKCALKQDKAEEILKCYEKKVVQMQMDYKLLHEEYFKSKAQVGALQEKNKSLLESHQEFKQERDKYIPLSVHSSAVNECKRLYEELKAQYEIEKEKLRDEITSKLNQINELNNKISVLNSEKDELENKVKSLEKHIKKAEGKYLDLQHTLNEVQLSRSACRKQLHKAMTFAKELVTEQECLLKALNDRKQENKVVKKLGTDIANRMDTLKNHLKSVQRGAWQELETVEVRLQEKDEIIAAMKEEHTQELEKLKELIKEKDVGVDSSIPLPHYLLFRDRNMHT